METRKTGFRARLLQLPKLAVATAGLSFSLCGATLPLAANAEETAANSSHELPFRNSEGELDLEWLDRTLASIGQDNASTGEQETALLPFNLPEELITSAECGFIPRERWKNEDQLSFFLGLRLPDEDAEGNIRNLQACYDRIALEAPSETLALATISESILRFVLQLNGERNDIYLQYEHLSGDNLFEVGDDLLDPSRVDHLDLLMMHFGALVEACGAPLNIHETPLACLTTFKSLQFDSDIADGLAALGEFELAGLAKTLSPRFWDDQFAFNDAARYFLFAGEAEAAEKVLRKAEAHYTNAGDAEGLVNPQQKLVWTLADQGRHREAIYYLEQSAVFLQNYVADRGTSAGRPLDADGVAAENMIETLQRIGFFENAMLWRDRAADLKASMRLDIAQERDIATERVNFERFLNSQAPWIDVYSDDELARVAGLYRDREKAEIYHYDLSLDFRDNERDLFGSTGWIEEPGILDQFARKFGNEEFSSSNEFFTVDRRKLDNWDGENIFYAFPLPSDPDFKAFEFAPADRDVVGMPLRLLYRARFLWKAGTIEEAEATLDLTELVLQSVPDEVRPPLARRLTAERCYLAHFNGQFAKARELCRSAVAQADAIENTSDAVFHRLRENALLREWTAIPGRVFLNASWEADGNGDQDGFRILQSALEGTVSEALVSAMARSVVARANPEAAGLVKDRDALEMEISDRRASLLAQMSRDGEVVAPEVVASQLAELGELETNLAALNRTIDSEFPQYDSFLNAEPARVEELKSFVGQDERVLLLLPTWSGTFSVIAGPENVSWHRSDLTEYDLENLVADIRADLVPVGQTQFNRAAAFQLYDELVAPHRQQLHEGMDLFVVAGGALSIIPLGVLVTEAPEGSDTDPGNLRATKWLADLVPITQIPSLSSLRFLRNLDRGRHGVNDAKEPASFAGFGDPVLQKPAPDKSAPDMPALAIGGTLVQTHSAGGRAFAANAADIRGLPELPGTAKELRLLASELGAGEDSLWLRERNTEAAIKQANLSDYSFLAIATHGLVAGEQGVAEAGLVFTPPAGSDAAEDGFLSASEIATLELAADWVILSACNTASGATAGESGMTGLAQSFFYAGAESLLVSHWPVRDDVAGELTVATIKAWKSDPDRSKSRALQAAMRSVRDDESDPTKAHPSAWAPFSLVGNN